MSHQPPFQRPPRTPFYADWFLPLYAALFGLGTCLFLSVQDERQIKRAPAYFGGWLVGLILPRLYRHRYRLLGFVPFLAALLTVWILIFGPTSDWPVYAIGIAGFFSGFGAGAILRYRDRFRKSIPHFYLLATLAAILGLSLIILYQPRLSVAYGWAYLVIALMITILGLTLLTRATIELFFENAFRPMYRVKTVGSSPDQIPLTGPVIVIANHAQWFDPLFLAKFLPRETTPMMTSAFYDLPILKFVMRRVFQTIRVQEKAVRREVPELQEALAALDAGKCLVVFPEGYLRRQEDQHLRRFGRGLWHILQARPDVPVVACWIEGSWGSFFSHFNGPPTKNKPLDKRRLITVGVGVPKVVPKQILEDHLATRLYLMQEVLAARQLLELDPIELPELRSTGEFEAATEC